MALSTANGFRFKRHLISSGAAPEPLQVRLGNSQTVTIGQAVRINTSGFAVVSNASDPIVGFVVGLVDSNGINPFSLIYDTTQAGVTLAPNSAGTEDNVTTSSTNTTRSTYMNAEIAIDAGGQMLFQNKTNGTLAQGHVGQFFNLTATADQVDTASASDTTGVVQCLAINPNGDDATVGLFRIATNQLLTQVGNSTAVRLA